LGELGLSANFICIGKAGNGIEMFPDALIDRELVLWLWL
jgi:hypothetical protein